ncbi:MAG: cytochrome c, partial [Rhodospirillaceae bacterium]|nr:cytochrome c [Rhodospirillaceae bacterium]
MIRNHLPGIVIGLLLGGVASAQTVEELVARGGELFNADIGCHVCHGPNAQGLVGPTLHFGPTPVDIFDQLESNPMMGVIVAEMDPSDADLEAIAMYIR